MNTPVRAPACLNVPTTPSATVSKACSAKNSTPLSRPSSWSQQGRGGLSTPGRHSAPQSLERPFLSLLSRRAGVVAGTSLLARPGARHSEQAGR